MSALPTPPSPDGPWGPRLQARFAGQALPLLHVAGETWTAASLWTGRRQWSATFRALGVTAGDRIAVALPPCAAFVQVLLTALRDQLTLAVLPPTPPSGITAALEAVDARVAVAETAAPHVLVPGEAGLPAVPLPAARRARLPASPDARLLLRTSGTTGLGRWVALGDTNLLSVLDSHAPVLAGPAPCVASMLPWHHVFGLVLDLLAGLLAGAELVRDPDGGRDPVALLARMADVPVTHCHAVPLTVARLAAVPGGRAWLEGLAGGIVGGAAVTGPLVDVLARTRLRAGYGQTEASPGVLLGDPGHWAEGMLGRPAGCAVRLDAEGELLFRGPNACLGLWTPTGLARLDPDRWVASGDLVAPRPDGTYRFLGRRAADFKLANGRMVAAARVEAALRERATGLREVALVSPDGETLELWYDADGAPPDMATLAHALGGLASRPPRLRPLPGAEWPRTPKGETDRAALRARRA
ncbi:MAG: class I adenylate-forming enzyme family protein [Gemmatimonadales bacterium]|nr:class I adenylate-forming enzyme family protein [Gemmatimonadales bacterium]